VPVVDLSEPVDAVEEGFRPVTAEKVLRLLGILREIQSLRSTRGRFTLKGGTALSVFHSPRTPRPSVDLDLMATGFPRASPGAPNTIGSCASCRTFYVGPATPWPQPTRPPPARSPAGTETHSEDRTRSRSTSTSSIVRLYSHRPPSRAPALPGRRPAIPVRSRGGTGESEARRGGVPTPETSMIST
jgi:hypothetical protein